MEFVKLCFILGAISLVSECSAYRILGVFPFNGKSHNIVIEALMKGLAKHGHQVDVITHYPDTKPVKNYNIIVNLAGSTENTMNNGTMELVSKVAADSTNFIATKVGNELCHLMGFEEMQKLIKNPPADPPYDIVITEAFGAHCYLGLGYVFNVPVAAISSAMEYPWISHYIGNDDNLAFVPNAYHIGSGKMNFWQRLKNVLIYHIEVRKFHTLTEESQTESMRKYLRPDMPGIREVEKNVALTLVNNHPVLFGVKPITPALVQIAGLHVETNDEVLPTELKEWMDASSHGVVYFTLGSMILIESLPQEQIKEIYFSFEKIAPVRALMKIVDTSKLPPGLPENVKVLPWIPQQPVLAHPNMKAFITHGGLGGVQEALYYGVPMIGIPLFSDQFRNVAAFVDKEMMVKIDLDKLSEETLDSALRAVLQNPVYKERSVHYSKLFRSRPIGVLENAIYWIEYVIQNGPDSLRSPALEFSWWQLALLDVYAFILLVVVLSIILAVLAVKFIFTKIVGKSKNRISDKKSKTR
ncbi:UDP-glucuronosyltransferase 2A2-like [Nasonia vitripennis]|uniref:UDP-glucuronosyltransferase n=1 Tax=Nasonia vitripennis TaxID=7425 RepID=A0A7M7G5B2_NASVI|nr:UDP-glucuronosyltransferase 2A2-like [Nasonia vitripennis]